jgi:hypothetical protein
MANNKHIQTIGPPGRGGKFLSIELDKKGIIDSLINQKPRTSSNAYTTEKFI